MRLYQAAGAGLCALALSWTAPASAGELFAGAFAHDVDLGIAICCYERGLDVELGGRTDPFAHILGGDLRAHALGSLDTDHGADFAAVGLDLRYRLGGRFYIQPGLGGAYQDGPTQKYQATSNRIYFGSPVLFEPELTLGWALAPDWAAELGYVHLSHAQLAGKQNPGMDDLGARLVYRFGR